MLASGKIDVESFIAAYPKSIMPNKKELLDAVGKTRQGVEAQLQQALALIQKQQGSNGQRAKDSKREQTAKGTVSCHSGGVFRSGRSKQSKPKSA